MTEEKIKAARSAGCNLVEKVPVFCHLFISTSEYWINWC